MQTSFTPLSSKKRQQVSRYPRAPYGTLNDKGFEISITLLNKNNLCLLLKTYRLALQYRASLCTEQRDQIQSLMDKVYFNLNHPSIVHIKLNNAKPYVHHTQDRNCLKRGALACIEERLLETHQILENLLNSPTPISEGLLDAIYNAIIQQRIILVGHVEVIKAGCVKYDTRYTLSKIEKLLADAEKIPKPGAPFAQAQQLIQRLMRPLLRRLSLSAR